MKKENKTKPKIKLWLQIGENPLGGEGRIKLLKQIKKEESLNKAAKKLKMSYKHAWNTIKKLEKRLDFQIVKTKKGGPEGGGTKLTEKGKKIVKKFDRMNTTLNKAIKEKTFWENVSTKISARNHLDGEIKDIDFGEVGAKIKIDVKPSEMTAYITREAAEDLNLEKGDKVKAVIKATEVMVSKPEEES